MPTIPRPNRRPPTRRRPRLEGLEARLALSGSPLPGAADGPAPAAGLPAELAPSPPGDPVEGVDLQALSIAGVEPAAGTQLDRSPEAVTLVFSQPLDPGSDGGSGNILLARVEADGTTTPILDTDHPPVEHLDDTGTRLSIVPPSTLEPGHYRVLLSGSAFLFFADGGLLFGPGIDAPLADFTVKAASTAPTLDQAEPIGPVVGAGAQVAGQLDLQSDPRAVRLYRVDLPAGGTWRLGLEVQAQRLGSPLDAALALFDAQGRPIATADRGRPDAPLDPYLFAALAPGTYYVGVSASGNLPGLAGGYDPATGSAGNAAPGRPGGAFTLNVVADPVAAPTTVRSAVLDHADPARTDPTGLTLRFSSALGLSPDGSLAGQLSGGVTLVDGQGRAWPLAASGYSEADARVSYLFGEPLPSGHYTLRLAAGGGLVDLDGRRPVAPGEPDGVLMEFDVADQAGPARPGDLGALYPDAIRGGLDAAYDLQPGQSIVVRGVITLADAYLLTTRYSGGAVSARIEHGGASFPLDLGAAGETNLTPQSLDAGEYQITLTNSGDAQAHVSLRLASAGGSRESLLDNGIGQGPALGLRLIAPPALPVSSPTPATAPAPTASEPTSDPTPAPAPAPGPAPSPGVGVGSIGDQGPQAAPQPSAWAGSPVVVVPPVAPAGGRSEATAPAAPIGGGAAFAATPMVVAPAMGGASEPMGRPSANPAHVTAVGPAAGPEGTAVALGQGGLAPGVLAGLGLEPESNPGAGDAASAGEGGPSPPSDGTNLADSRDAEADGANLEAPTVPGGPSWLDRVLAAVERLFDGQPGSAAPPTPAPAGPADARRLIASAGLDSLGPAEEPGSPDGHEEASLTPVVGVALVAGLTYGYRDVARRRRGRLAGRRKASERRSRPSSSPPDPTRWN